MNRSGQKKIVAIFMVLGALFVTIGSVEVLDWIYGDPKEAPEWLKYSTLLLVGLSLIYSGKKIVLAFKKEEK